MKAASKPSYVWNNLLTDYRSRKPILIEDLKLEIETLIDK